MCTITLAGQQLAHLPAIDQALILAGEGIRGKNNMRIRK